jgi:phage-related protein
MRWTVVFFDVHVEAALLELQPSFIARFIRYAERMEEFGPNLGMPHTRAMGKGLFELRLQAPDGLARIFHCVLSDRRVVILHHFAKKSAKTPARELAMARKRLEEIAG